MSLENANFFWQWIPTNPTLADFVKEGDDHLRLIKRGVQNAFPNIKAAITVDHTTLNSIPTNLAQKIAALALHTVPKGMIMGWDMLTMGPVPTGWALCNGQVVQGYGTTPNMVNLFVKGWNGTNQGAGVTGGSATPSTSQAGAHSHTATSGPIALTVSQLPTINFATKGSYSAGGYDGGANQFFRILPGDGFSQSGIIDSIGGNQTHAHPDGTTNEAGNHEHTVAIDPPHYRMVWVVKVTDLVLP